MEEKYENLDPLLENYKKNIIRDTVKKIYKKYSIYDNNENLISESQIIGYITKLNIKQPKKRCCGILTSLIPKQCTKKAVEDHDYCKNHILIYSNKFYDDDIVSEQVIINNDNDNINNDNDNDNNNSMKKKFIGDSFYYIDTEFIYNNFKEKVGYIQDNEYNLTDDPFILNSNSN